MNIYLSKKPEKTGGGGSTTFAWNFAGWAQKNGHKVVDNIQLAERAIIIAHLTDIKELEKAKRQGVYIVHRIDEYFESTESNYRKEKHEKILNINKLADITVFQSKFVSENAFPFLRPKKHTIIINGANPKAFNPGVFKKQGKYIGHITWSIGQSKHLEILYEKIQSTPQETFLLVGRHNTSAFNFNLKNVKLVGAKSRKELPSLIRKMKLLFYPAQKDPCSNTVIESIISGVPVCYNTPGGTSEIVRDCGATLSEYQSLIDNLDVYRKRCLKRKDLYFDQVAEKYLAL